MYGGRTYVQEEYIILLLFYDRMPAVLQKKLRAVIYVQAAGISSQLQESEFALGIHTDIMMLSVS